MLCSDCCCPISPNAFLRRLKLKLRENLVYPSSLLLSSCGQTGVSIRICFKRRLVSLLKTSMIEEVVDFLFSLGDKMSVSVEEIQASSVTIRLDSEESSSSLQSQFTGFKLFCRKSKDEECSSQVNSVVYLPEMKSTIHGLEHETEFCDFCLKVVSFNEEGDIDESEIRFSMLKDDADITGNQQSPLTNSSSSLCSNPSFPQDESNVLNNLQ